MKMITKNCLWCNKEFQVDVYTDKRGNGKFCSLKCVSRHTADKNKPKPNTECGYCHVPIYKNKSDFKKSRTGIFFCCIEHRALSQSFGGALYKREMELSTRTIEKDYRLIIFRQIENPSCNRCGYDIREALQVHHKDRNRSNNSIENLEILCCNCHAIEHRKR